MVTGLVFIATSLDGFIAREDGGIDWLTGGGDAGEAGSGAGEAGDREAAPARDYGYTAFFGSVDGMVMGRSTYELVRSFGGAWPYGSKPVFVLTSRRLEDEGALPETVERVSGSPSDVARVMEERGLERIYVDGGKTIQGFLDHGLIHRLVITRIPILIGRGIPLFGPVPKDVRLRHIRTESFSSGLVQSEYEVDGAA